MSDEFLTRIFYVVQNADCTECVNERINKIHIVEFSINNAINFRIFLNRKRMRFAGRRTARIDIDVLLETWGNLFAQLSVCLHCTDVSTKRSPTHTPPVIDRWYTVSPFRKAQSVNTFLFVTSETCINSRHLYFSFTFN